MMDDVSVLLKHTCPMADRFFTQRQATIGFIAGITVPQLNNHKRKHTPNDIREDVKKTMGVDIDYMKAWRAKERAEKIVRGGPTSGYRQMPRYLYMLGLVYPKSYIRMHKSPQNEFMYLFFALYLFIRGFDYCRPIVVVDGSHMDGPYKGTFLSANTLDGAGTASHASASFKGCALAWVGSSLSLFPPSSDFFTP